MNKLLVILGPTATGKTDLGLFLAKKFNGELVSCDSRQVYKGLDIGTGKLPNSTYEVKRTRPRRSVWEIDGVRVWMYDVVDPKVQYTVADYVKDAQEVISTITKRGKLPIIVGGTGLYLKALLDGLPNLAIPVDQSLRRELSKLTLTKLQKKLQLLSSTKWKRMNQSDRQNKRRLLRSIELILMNPYISTKKRTGLANKFNILKIGLTAPRKVLYRNADLRILTRLDQGMIKEAKNLHQRGLPLTRMKELGLEYGVLANYLQGKIETEQDLISILKGKIHGFLRRQLIWFKKEKGINWFDITERKFYQRVENIISKWYDQKHVLDDAIDKTKEQIAVFKYHPK